MKRSIAAALVSFLLLAGCASTPDAAPASQPPSPDSPDASLSTPAPVLDTPSNVPDGLVVTTPEPAMTLRIDARRVVLEREGNTRTLAVDSNELIFAGRHVMAHDAQGNVDILVAGQLCQHPVSGEWVPYSARVTLDDGGFIFGCAQDAPPP